MNIWAGLIYNNIYWNIIIVIILFTKFIMGLGYGVLGRELQQLVIREHEEMHARNSVSSRLHLEMCVVYVHLAQVWVWVWVKVRDHGYGYGDTTVANALNPSCHTAGNYCNRLQTCLTQDHELKRSFIREKLFPWLLFCPTDSSTPLRYYFHYYCFNQHCNYY